MSFLGDILKGGAEGVLKGAGGFAIAVRTAITGEAPLTAEQKARLIEQAAAIEAASEQAIVELQKAQIEVNKEEAKSGSSFRGGWRPLIGYVCGGGVAYQFLIRPILPWVVNLWTTVPPMPTLETDTLMTLLFGILGLGAYRSYEYIKGVEKK